MGKLFDFAKTHKLISIFGSIAIVSTLLVGTAFTCLGIRASLRRSKGIVPSDEQVQNAVKYNRVVIFGVDGAGQYIRDAETPNIDKIFKDGAITYQAYTQLRSDSGPNWASMLRGVRHKKHKINNENSSVTQKTNEKYPSIFKIYNSYYPNAKHLSVSNWENINESIIEDLDFVTKITPKDDTIVMNKFMEEFTIVNPVISFIQLDNVDACGHGGGRNQNYYNAITDVDSKIGKIYSYLELNGFVDKTLFICASDHGHKKSGGHGQELSSIYLTTIAVNGNLGNIKAGEMGKVVTQDVASIVLYALGIKQPSYFDGKIPYNVFTTL